MSSSTTLSIAAGMGALRTNPLRTILSTLGVIIGVASLVAILSIGDSLEQFSRDQIVQTTDLQTLQLSSRTDEVLDGIRIKLEEPVRFSAADFTSLDSLVGKDGIVVPVVSWSARTALEGDTTHSVALISATTPTAIKLMKDGAVKYGRFLTEADQVANLGALPAAAVVSSQLAARLTPDAADSLLIGRTIAVDTIRVTVVGILADAGGTTPRAAIAMRGNSLGPPSRSPEFTIRASGIELVEPLEAKIKTWLAERYPDREKQFVVATSRQRVAQVARGMLVFKLGLGAIAAISLIVGGIGIMNVLLASVAERTREIGVRKAAGARRFDILAQFLAESVSITGFGAVLGVVLGLGASAGIMILIRSITDAPVGVSFEWASVLIAAVAAIVIGLVFGMFPAVRASKLSPVDAIRHE